MSASSTAARPSQPAKVPVRPGTIPAVLKAERRWVCWDWRWPEDRDDWAKVPLNPRTGHNAKSNRPTTWGTYDEAMAYHLANPDTTSGIGFMLGDGWVGVDVDDCITDGEVSDFAIGIIRRLDTYAEISPSGQGIKAIGRGVHRLPRDKGAKDSKLGLEVYSKGRFFTTTGQHWHGDGVADIADAIAWLYDTHLPHKKDGAGNRNSHRTTEPPPPLDMADEEVIALMTTRAKNCIKVAKLWRGDMGDYLDSTGNPDESRADAALCSHIAFYTQDPARIDRLFRQSELGKRAKWTERADYRDMTIGFALSDLKNKYEPAVPVKITVGEVEIRNDSPPGPVAVVVPTNPPSQSPVEPPPAEVPEPPREQPTADELPAGDGPPDDPPGEAEAGDDAEPKAPRPEGPYDLGGGFSIKFRHVKRDMTEAFLFLGGKGVNTERLNVRSGARRDGLAARWAAVHDGLDSTKLAAALTAFAFYDPPGRPEPGDDEDDDRPEIELTSDEHRDREAVLSHLAADPLLFVRDGELVRPKVYDQTQEPRPDGARRTLTWKRPAGTTAMIPASVAYVRTRIGSACRLTRPGIGPTPCPDYLPSGLHAAPDGIREVSGLALGPILRPDGSLINRRGYDEPSGLYLAADVPGLERLIPDEVSVEVARKALATWWTPLLKNFPWRGADEDERRVERARWHCCLFTAVLRHMLEQVPLGLITANNAGSGKTYLCLIIGIVAHGSDPMTLTWPEGSKFQNRGDEVRKKLASLLHESATLALIDNLPRGDWFSSPELDAFLTSSSFYDRKLGQNDGSRVGGAQRCQLLATGNNVEPAGDTADRTLHIRLQIDHPNPRARPVTDFDRGDALLYARRHRRELLAAALTCVRGWIQAGQPCPPGESWGSFSEWTDTVAGLVRWLCPSVDPLLGRSSAATGDPETAALTGLIANWQRVFGPAHVSVGKVLREVEERDSAGVRRHLSTDQEALRDSLLEVCCTKDLPGNRLLGCRLAGFVNRRVPMLSEGNETMYGWLETKTDSHTKANLYRVQQKVEAGP